MALSRHLSGRAEENHETFQSVWWWICRPRLETDTFRMHVRSVPTCSVNRVSIDLLVLHLRSSYRRLVSRLLLTHLSSLAQAKHPVCVTTCSDCSSNDTSALCLDRCNKLRRVITSLETTAQRMSLWSSQATVKVTKAGPWLRRFVASLPPRRPGFDPGLVHVGFVVDKVALGQVFPPST
jgi:hypothetical protein